MHVLPNWELNRQPFALWDGAKPTELHTSQGSGGHSYSNATCRRDVGNYGLFFLFCFEFCKNTMCIGTRVSLNSCVWLTACNCNGRAQECYFDPELYRSTGHGGHCTNCQDNTDGPNCERCRENFFRLGSTEACSPCHCSPVGECRVVFASAWWGESGGRQEEAFSVSPGNKAAS